MAKKLKKGKQKLENKTKYQLHRSQYRLKDSEILKIFAVADTMRDQLIILLLWKCGIRCSELCQLQISDCDFPAKRLRIFGKGRKVRYIPLSSAVCVFLDNYIKNILPHRAAWLFPSIQNQGKPLTRMQIFLITRKLGEKAGVKNPNPGLKSINPHTFRHSFAHRLIENNFRAREVADLLGHVDIRTTENSYGRSSYDTLETKMGALDEKVPSFL